MANVFKLYVHDTINNTEPVSLDLSGYVTGWRPSAPKIDEGYLVESIELSNVTLADWESIESVLSLARIHSTQNNYGQHVYFEYDLDVSRVAYRCQIYDGEMVTNESNIGSDIANARYSGSLVIKRDPYWEEKSSTSFTLYNVNGNGSSMTILNCNDLSGSVPNKRVNYVEIRDSESVERVALTVSLQALKTGYFGSNITWGKIVVGMLNASGFTHHIEVTGGSTQSDSASSGGSFERFSLSSTMTTLVNITLTNSASPVYNLYRNCYFMVVVRFANAPPANTYMQLQQNSRPSYSGPAVKLGSNLLQVLDVVKVPPDEGWMRNDSSRLTFKAKGSGNLDIDFITLIPVESYAIVEASDTYLYSSNDSVLTIDSSSMTAHVSDFSNTINHQIPMSGPGIFMIPDNSKLGDSRLIVITATGTSGAGFDITAGYTISVKGRKRLWTI